MVTMASNLTNSSVSSSPAQGDVTTTTVLPKKGSENRRSNKPIMEKRRRARINNCLNELKTLMLDTMKKDPARHSKLEKADILEMTVKYLESLQRQQVAMSAVTDPQVVNKFKAGFSECAGEVGRFPGLEPAVRRRLLQHLANCLTSTAAAASSNSSSLNPDLSNRISSQQNLQVHILPSNGGTLPAQNGIFLSAGATTGVQLLPTRLPNGDIALVLPSMSAQQRLTSSPTPSSSSSSSPPPLAMLTPSRTASTGSAASSSNSSIAFERLSVNTNCSSSSVTATDDVCHSPSSTHSTYSAPESPVPSGIPYDSYSRPLSPPLQKPLSLVVREEASYYADEKPWRPW